MPDNTAQTAAPQENFQPVAEDWQWKPGDVFRIETPLAADQATLTVVAPVTYEEFQTLVNNIFFEKRNALAKEWGAQLAKHGLLDVESFRAAAQKAKPDGKS